MKSENDASPAADEEVIELTDIVKSGPEAEEAIIDLTDPIETVKAEPHDAAAAAADTLAVDATESMADEVQEVFDLTTPLDTGDVAEDTENILDLDDVLDDTAEAALDLDLEDALEDSAEAALDLNLEDALAGPDSEDTVLDLDEALDNDEAVLDLNQAVADVEQEAEATPEVLDLAEVLDAAEAAEGVLELEDPLDPGEADTETAEVAVEEALEEIDADPESTEIDLFDDADALVELDAPLEEMTAVDPDLLENDTEEILDLDSVLDEEDAEPATAEPAADSAPSSLDDDDDLEFKLDDMLAEAQADMPDMDDDEADMELDLSEALADAAADSDGEATDGELDLPAAEGAEDLDLISADMVIDLDDPATVEATAAVAQEEALDMAEITGGYPTVSAASDSDGEAPPAAQDSLAETPSSDLEIDEDAPVAEAAAADPQLNPEMQALQKTLDDMFEDEEGDEDLETMMAGDAGEDSSDEPAADVVKAVEVDDSDDDAASTAADAAAAGVAGAAALGAAAMAATADDDPSSEDSAPVQPAADIPEAALDAAVERVIKTMYADRIEQMILDVIKEAVTAEIEKVKRSLTGTGSGAE